MIRCNLKLCNLKLSHGNDPMQLETLQLETLQLETLQIETTTTEAREEVAEAHEEGVAERDACAVPSPEARWGQTMRC